MIDRIEAIARCVEANAEAAAMVAGIHVEGPFLNRADGYIGAHPVAAAREATINDAKRLMDAGRGLVRLVTLAPEMDNGAAVTKMLSDAGIAVAAGHCDASMDQLHQGLDNGLKLFTHLGNSCPALLPRHDNIVQRVLSLSDQLMISFIADGHHVPGFALANYLQCVPDRNIVIVSDAISAAGLGPGKFQLAGQTVTVDPDGATWAECRTHYAGCATPLGRMAEWLQAELGAGKRQIERWCRTNPARLI